MRIISVSDQWVGVLDDGTTRVLVRRYQNGDVTASTRPAGARTWSPEHVLTAEET